MSSSLKLRALIDSNIFIYAFELPESNCNLIINALNQNRFEAVVTESTFKEVYAYFRKHYLKELADEYRTYLFATCRIVFKHQLEKLFRKYSSLINQKDLEQLVATRELGIKYLVSFDRHFQDIEEHVTPRQFGKILDIKVKPTEY